LSTKKILILDYSTDQSETPAIKRWVPDNAQVVSCFVDTEKSFPDDLIEQGFSHVIHSGSALSITKSEPFTEKAMRYIKHCSQNGIAQMGICYGHQLICLALIGEQAVRSSPNGLEAGWNKVKFTQAGVEAFGVKEYERVWQYHFDEVTALPEGSMLLATNGHSQIQAYINPVKRLLGTQFHPEFDREAGNNIFVQDKVQLGKNGYDYNELISGAPSFETGINVFGFFFSL
jgi:GMP synthase-like glutamine amidotransferase